MSGSEFVLFDLPALVFSVGMLVLGIRLAYRGRLARGRWRQVVEGIAFAVLMTVVTNLVTLATARTVLPPQASAAISLGCAVAAYFIAGRTTGLLYGLMGALLGAVAGFAVGWLTTALTPLDSMWIALASAALGLVIGYERGRGLHAQVVAFTTALTGASWVATSASGFVQVLLGEAADFLGDLVLGIVLPILAHVLAIGRALTDGGAFVVLSASAALFLVVLSTGWRQQRADLAKVPSPADDFGPWIRAATRDAKIRWIVAGVVVVYVGLFVGLRVLAPGGQGEPKAPTAPVR